MICYFDTSALVPLLIAEPTSALCGRLWNDADTVVTCRIADVEAAAALAQAQRLLRITASTHHDALQRFELLWEETEVMEVDETLVRRGAVLAAELGLRGYDALHAAAGEALGDSDTLCVAGDAQLLDAWAALGLETVDVTATPG